MNNTNGAEVDIILNYGSRQKICSSMSRTTTRQEFTEHLQKWLGDKFLQNYSASFYDKKLKKMIQLVNLEMSYLTPIFDSISFESEAEGVQPVLSNDYLHVILYISDESSSTSSHLSTDAFAEEFNLQLDKFVAANIHSTTATTLVSSDNSSWPTHNDLLQNNSFDKDVLTSNDDDIQKDAESSIADQYVSPTTNIQSPLADHIRIVHDICPTPKRLNYVSNMGKKGKSNLAYLSGIRGPNDRGKQIRPILFIPDVVLKWLQEVNSLGLVVACVRETLVNGIRIWWIDTHSEFRTKGCKRNTPGHNPIELPLTLNDIKNDHYTLNVILTHIPCKIGEDRKGEQLYFLDEATLKQLHSAEHDSESSRLLFMISCYGFPVESTTGFSNFIKDPKNKKNTASTVNRNDLEPIEIPEFPRC